MESTPPLRLRLATEQDAEALLGIYRPIVEHTHISFELEPPSTEEMARRIADYGALAPYLVCEEGGVILGFAYAAPFRPRRAYRFSVETTVYVAETARRRGVARALYRALIECLRAQGFVTAVAGISLPNEASVALHESLGFQPAALLPAIGYKHAAWRDVGWWSLRLREPPADPSEPFSVDSLDGLDAILDQDARAIRAPAPRCAPSRRSSPKDPGER